MFFRTTTVAEPVERFNLCRPPTILCQFHGDVKLLRREAVLRPEEPLLLQSVSIENGRGRQSGLRVNKTNISAEFVFKYR